MPRLGLDFNAQRRAVLRQPRRGAPSSSPPTSQAGRQPGPDLVVWPENASDIDPYRNADARAADRPARPRRSGCRSWSAPSPTARTPDDDHATPAIVWDPAHRARAERYVKRHPVPFAEYMPLRSFARLVSDKVDLVRRDFVAGDRPGRAATSARPRSAT